MSGHWFCKVTLICLLLFNCANAEWIKQSSQTLTSLHSVFFLDATVGWIAGSNGTLLKTENGGKNWKKINYPIKDDIKDIRFRDSVNGWILCESSAYESGKRPFSYLMHTLDGGVTWRKIDFAEAGARMNRFTSGRGERFFTVGEGGVVWLIDSSTETVARIQLPVRYLIFGGTSIDGVNIVLVGGAGTVLVSTDGGDSWKQAYVDTKVSVKALRAAFFLNATTGWAVGDSGRVLKTDDGGFTWKPRSTNVAQNLYDVVFIDATRGFAIGDQGVILGTTNGGETWVANSSVTRNRLERLVFREDIGIAVGFGGTILTYGVLTREAKLSVS